MWVSDEGSESLLNKIYKELKIMNIYLSQIVGEEITKQEL